MELFFAWAFALMTLAAPPERIAAMPAYPGWEETAEEREARYREIAEAAVRVAFAPDEQPLFGGPSGRAKTAAALLAVAFHESGFAKDVDLGPCYRGRDGRSTRCDSGRSACMMQVQVGHRGKTTRGYTQGDLFADREKCFQTGLDILRASERACRRAKTPPEHRWAAYAGGGCYSTAAKRGSAELVRFAERWIGRLPIPPKEKPGS